MMTAVADPAGHDVQPHLSRLGPRLHALAHDEDSVPLLMGWCTLGNTFAAETVGRSGADLVCLDVEHGLTGWDSALLTVMTLSAGRIPVVVRVRSHAPSDMMRALDAGADGIVVPHIENASEAERAVDACQYPPRGHRSWGPTRTSLLNAADTDEVNEHVGLIAMVESAAAVDNAVEIATSQHVDAVLVGSNDLSLDMTTAERNRSAARTSADFRDLLAAVASACKRAGIPAAAPAASPAEAAMLLELGYQILVLPSDAALLRDAVRREAVQLRPGQGSESPAADRY
jgi:4-hydroxy-2-oxoheptanedioate aldolase